MSKKQKSEIPQEVFDKVAHILKNARPSESYLFIGNVYDVTFNKVYEKLCFEKSIYLYKIYKASDFELFLNFLTVYPGVFIDGDGILFSIARHRRTKASDDVAVFFLLTLSHCAWDSGKFRVKPFQGNEAILTLSAKKVTRIVFLQSAGDV
jgi:hypothetical protein